MLEVGDAASVEVAVVALAQPGVLPQRRRREPAKAMAHRLDGAGEVGVDTAAYPSGRRRSPSSAASRDGATVDRAATGGDALLVVLGRRVRLVGEVMATRVSRRGRWTAHPAELPRLRRRALPVLSQMLASSSIIPPPTFSARQRDPQPARRRAAADVAGELERRRPAEDAEVEGHRRQGSSAIMSSVVSGSRWSRSAQPARGSRPASTACRGPAGGGRVEAQVERLEEALLARKSGGAWSDDTHRSGGGRSGGVDCLSVSTCSRLPKDAIARIRSTGAPSDRPGSTRDLPGREHPAAAHDLCRHGERAGRSTRS